MAATGIPDISVQLISPSDTSAGMAREVAEYLAAGTLRSGRCIRMATGWLSTAPTAQFFPAARAT